MRMTSNRELARQLGVSETAVRRAEKAGRIGRETDGAWDLAKVRAAWAGNTDPAQQRGEPTAASGESQAREARSCLGHSDGGRVAARSRRADVPLAARVGETANRLRQDLLGQPQHDVGEEDAERNRCEEHDI
jgi:hypothetical protein